MYQYNAKLVRVIDADTVALDIDLGFYQWRLGRNYRLARINAPEISTTKGKVSRDALIEQLRIVNSFLVATQKADSFDRWIVELYADGINISDWLVSNNLAVSHIYR